MIDAGQPERSILLQQRLVQQRLAAARQRLQQRSAQTLVAELGIAAADCTIVLPDTLQSKQVEQWLTQAFPWQWGQLNWQAIPDHGCEQWHSYDHAADLLRQFCQRYYLGNPIVTVIWFSADRPSLCLTLGQVQQVAPAIFAQDWDTWIINPEAGWCIECHHEGTLCYGTTPLPTLDVGS